MALFHRVDADRGDDGTLVLAREGPVARRVVDDILFRVAEPLDAERCGASAVEIERILRVEIMLEEAGRECCLFCVVE